MLFSFMFNFQVFSTEQRDAMSCLRSLYRPPLWEVPWRFKKFGLDYCQIMRKKHSLSKTKLEIHLS